MIKPRTAIAVLLGVALVAGCSSSESPKKSAPSTANARSSSSSALAAKLSAALDTLSSAHLATDAGSLGGTSTADVQLAKGEATATDVHLTESGQAVEVITVGGTKYAKIAGTSKPWTLVSPTSSNAVAKALATGTNVTDVLSSLSVLVGLVRSSHDVKGLGTSADGMHYTFQLDPQKGTGNQKLDSMLAVLGKSQVPVDLWLDGQSRPLKIVLHVALGGVQLPITATISKFDEPLSIQAPPASEVGS